MSGTNRRHLSCRRTRALGSRVQSAILVAIVGINLLSAFGPPTWVDLVFGALAARCGRSLLAVGARHFKDRMPERLEVNLEDATTLIERKRVGVIVLFGSS